MSPYWGRVTVRRHPEVAAKRPSKDASSGVAAGTLRGSALRAEHLRVTEDKSTSVAAAIISNAPIEKRDTWIMQEPMEPGMTSSDQPHVKIRVGADGSNVVPVTLSEALGLKEGDVLFARVQNGEIHLLTTTAVARRAQAIVREFVPEGVSLVDELLEDRRREVEAERRDD
jgi:antitoxin PrlF